MAVRVVVGVDGTEPGWRALAFAVEEARVRHAPLEIRHCWQAPREATAPSGTIMPIVSIGARPTTAAQRIAATAWERAVATLPTHHVQAELVEGPPGAALAEQVTPADILVVGARSTHRLTARWLGSTASRVLNQAPSAVIVVPPHTTTPEEQPFAGHVVLGVAPSAAAAAVLRFGFATARAHDWPLAAVHATTTNDIDSYIDERTLEVQLSPLPPEYGYLQRVLEHWHHANPSTPVRRAVFHGPPTTALARAAAGARLLVLGRTHRSALRRGIEPLAERLITRATCPVAVTPFA
ncbi:universal stress protein [Allokutzneria albata]|uniref:Nucleotide-binding universal stress protein, UspA family n=1 Tax=Allokutzneria albata TaxID=211114 RepID=A0A1G9T560_ALLAB|nr:universal stress protein [Allokutzneria albata]SDM42758.1 Nucleotide-binding universal stress protein, UspA family [Allokutzneria albata]